MEFMSAKEAANKWGISKRRVQVLCAEKRIVGANKVGMVWVIPKEAEKPIDERRKGKSAQF
ncbi:helix-turn-helix domain-containing protein [Fictibacillus sp. BK138]|uniref:helix-turn-helix domain-containing protein n=1 Tax=Fictibacillus sp. BK138 TaxID=2512121 RepID=UPI00102895A4|nr:helix-turn-helix domain-containing protein [Fictibacillus sp. BK138]RZT23606.1 helix-turn-helix protein [Fictibacillus sp. BK138]